MDAVVLTTMKGLKFEVFLRSGRPSRQPDLQVRAHAAARCKHVWLFTVTQLDCS
jgi:hypothetical protein